jgi:hypothetical protein
LGVFVLPSSLLRAQAFGPWVEHGSPSLQKSAIIRNDKRSMSKKSAFDVYKVAAALRQMTAQRRL